MAVLLDEAVDEVTVAAPAGRGGRRRRLGLVVFDSAVVVLFWLVATNATTALAGLLGVPEAGVAIVLGVVLGALAVLGAAWVHRAFPADLPASSDAYPDDAYLDAYLDDAYLDDAYLDDAYADEAYGGEAYDAYLGEDDPDGTVDLTDDVVDLTAVEAQGAPVAAGGSSFVHTRKKRRRRNR